MPWRVKSPCPWPGCPNMRPCAIHAPLTQSWSPDKRPNATKRGYGSDWAKVRRTFLARHMRCDICGELAVVAHHRIPVTEAPELRLEFFNLQALCRKCHEHVHGRA